MRRLSAISYRSLLHRKGRYALTGIGIALGVGILFAVLVSSGATTRGLDRFIDGVTGRADVVVSPVGTFEADLPAAVEDRVAQLPDVELAVGTLGFRSSIETPAEPEGLIVFTNGVDLEASRPVHDYDLAEGRFFNDGAPEVVVPRSLLRDVEVGVGDQVLLATPNGQREVTIVGALHDRGASYANAGDVAYTSLRTARAFTGKGDVYTRVDVVLASGVGREEWIDANRPALGEGVNLLDSDDLASEFRTFLTTIQGGLTLMAAIALFVGAFLIFLTFTVAVTERIRMYGTLRALGAVPRQVRRVVVREALALAFVSSLAGLVVGYVLGSASLGLIESLTDIDVPSPGLPLGAAVFALALGLVTTLVSSLLPARRAAALSPVAAMQGTHSIDDKPPRSLVGLVSLALGVLLQVATSGQGTRALGSLLVLLGAVLLVPYVLLPLSRLLGSVTARMARGVGDIAVMHLAKERSRSAYTLALVMVVLSMILGIGAFNLAMLRSLDDVVDRQFGTDYQVFAPGSFEPGFGERLAAVEGVRAVTPIRFGETEVLEDDGDKRTTFLVTVDPASYFEVSSFAWVDGNDAAAREALAAGGSVLLPEAEADRLGVERGEQVTLRTQTGSRQFEIAGTYAFLGQPNVTAGLPDGVRLFGAARPHGYFVDAVDGADLAAVRQRIEAVGERYGAVIDSAAEVKRQFTDQVAGFTGIAYAVLLAAAVIGMLGLANTLVVSVIQRTREIGVLRSTGALRRQVRGMVLVEGATLLLVAYLLSLVLGWLTGTLAVSGFSSSLGFSVEYAYPWIFLPILALGLLVLGGLASLLPARRASRLEIVSALRFD